MYLHLFAIGNDDDDDDDIAKSWGLRARAFRPGARTGCRSIVGVSF